MKAAAARRRRALEDSANRRATDLASLYRETGLSYGVIAHTLNSNGHTARRGGGFHACTIERLLKRADRNQFALKAA